MKPETFDFESMRRVDIQTVDPGALVELCDAEIKTDLPFNKRINDYLAQIKNAYCFLCGGVAVKISYGRTDTTLGDCMEIYTRSLYK